MFQNIVLNVCNNYLGLESIPVIFDDIEGLVSMLNVKAPLRVINRKYKYNKLVAVTSILHELEHYYQILYVAHNDTPKAKKWYKEISNHINETRPLENAIQEIEIDAEAFAIVVLECEYGLHYQNPDPTTQGIIDRYIKLGKLLNDD